MAFIISILKKSTIKTTLINIIVDANNVQTTYKSIFFLSFFEFSVIEAVTAVEDISHPIAPEAIILFFSQINFESIYHT
jgi:hypothetical protein